MGVGDIHVQGTVSEFCFRSLFLFYVKKRVTFYFFFKYYFYILLKKKHDPRLI